MRTPCRLATMSPRPRETWPGRRLRAASVSWIEISSNLWPHAHEKMRHRRCSRAWGKSKITRREIYPRLMQARPSRMASSERPRAEKWVYFFLSPRVRRGNCFADAAHARHITPLAGAPLVGASMRSTAYLGSLAVARYWYRRPEFYRSLKCPRPWHGADVCALRRLALPGVGRA